jgi:hypothetical protein
MPVDVTSRYWALQAYEAPGREGTVSALPTRPNDPPSGAEVVNHRLSGVETIEYLSWRYYGRSAAWWHIADANPIAFPLDLRPGATVKVAPSGSINRIIRTRTF